MTMTMTAALPAFLDGQHLVESFGLVGLLLVVFAETGLLLGFFLPGDSLLFAAGFAATGKLAQGLHPKIALVCVLASMAAVAGAQTGFAIGRFAGPSLLKKEDSRLLKRSYVERSNAVIERYGAGRAVVLARFVPVVRTFLNPLLGAGPVRASRFLLWNVVGGVLWGSGVPLLGYFLGNISVIGKNLELVALLIVAVSVAPLAIDFLKRRSGSSP